MTRAVWLAVVAGLALGLASPVASQSRGVPQQDRAPPPPVEAPPPAYEPHLLKLSEVLGALSYLGDLCAPAAADGTGGGALWRAKMTELMEAEAPTLTGRERLAGAFNRGYSGYQATHHTCTDAGRLALDRLAREGARIAAELTGRFGT